MTSAEELESWLRLAAPPEWVDAIDRGDADALRDIASGPDGSDLHTRAAAQGWMTPAWPAEYGGRGLGTEAAGAVGAVIRRWQIGHVNAAVGVAWIGPTILEWGTEEQRRRFLPPIARLDEQWCQMFSEPGAGSDLAAIATRAVRDGDRWVINGQKVWTSRAAISRRGLLIARTDPDVAKHAGLSAFCLDLTSPGVEVRPLRQMTGDAEFFEVFLDDVVVADDDVLGRPGDGWAVCRAALAKERVAGSGTGAAPPGSVVGRGVAELLDRHRGTCDAVTRQRLASIAIESRLVELNNARSMASAGTDRAVPPAVTKVLQAEHTKRLQRLFVDLEGAAGIAWSEDDRWAASNRWAFLRVQAKTIAGGTSEVLRSQLAERTLGLPRDTDPTRGLPWREAVRLAAGPG